MISERVQQSTAPYTTALTALTRAEDLLREGIPEESTTAGKTLLRNAAEDCRCRREALFALAERVTP